MAGAIVVRSSSAAANAEPNSRMYIAILTAMIGAIMFGIDCGNFGAVQGFRSFREEWCVNNFGDEVSCGEDPDTGATHNAEWLGSFVMLSSLLIFVGAAVGALVLGPSISNNYGRRPCICTGAVITLIGSLLTSWLSFSSVAIFYFGRLVTGFGIGVSCFSLPMYNAEVSAPKIRGVTGALFQFNVVVGQLIASVVTLADHHWQIGMILPGIAGAVIAVTVWFTPESPRYVMAKKGYQEGLEVLTKLRSGDVTAEAQEVNEQIAAEAAAGQVSWLQMYKEASLRKRVAIAMWLQFAQQFTGFNVLVMFSSTLFLEMGFEDPFMVNLAFTAVQTVGLLTGIWLLDSSGGRRIQLMGVTSVIIPLFLLTGIAAMFDWVHAFSLVLVMLIGFIWQCAWGMIPWIYPSELFSMAERDRAMGLAVFVQYGANGILMFVFPPMLSCLGAGGALLVFAEFNVLNLMFVYMFIQETKGVPLEEIPAMFGASPAQSKIAEVTDQREVAV